MSNCVCSRKLPYFSAGMGEGNGTALCIPNFSVRLALLTSKTSTYRGRRHISGFLNKNPPKYVKLEVLKVTAEIIK